MGKTKAKKDYKSMNLKLAKEARERLDAYVDLTKMDMTQVIEGLILGKISLKPVFSSGLSDLSPAEAAVVGRLLDELISVMTGLRLQLKPRPVS